MVSVRRSGYGLSKLYYVPSSTAERLGYCRIIIFHNAIFTGSGHGIVEPNYIALPYRGAVRVL